ncbi:hypothetical protein PB1_05150 [Bacillus methanolicus PB1]|uniref:Uncharacterized protein n=1 Tax=Bacillus methanolicus PB1 TaxID=997296 RepID=I3E719_BACMT|nr:hypothetical protein [Bacillus methanolicus]EIJ82290.1 hypothetical protein PB1_05150 [Bacillus methanolicus PB1]
MSKGKKEKVIHVDKLIIHAKEVDIIHERKEDDRRDERKRDDFQRIDPWGFLWGRPRRIRENEQQSTSQEKQEDSVE